MTVVSYVALRVKDGVVREMVPYRAQFDAFQHVPYGHCSLPLAVHPSSSYIPPSEGSLSVGNHIISPVGGTTIRLGESLWAIRPVGSLSHLRGLARRRQARNRSSYVRWAVRPRSPPNARAEVKGAGARAMPRNMEPPPVTGVPGGRCEPPPGFAARGCATALTSTHRCGGCGGILM